MFCPLCRSEFESWVKTCPDCDAALVPELPAEPSHEAPERRCVLSTSDPALVPAMTSALQAAGIPFWTTGEGTVGLWPVGSGSGSPATNLLAVEIWVGAEHLDEARAILESAAVPDGFEPEPELDPELDPEEGSS